MIAVIVCSSAADAADDTPLSLEYPVKAAYLYQFTRFVEWPDRVAPDTAGFCIGLLGTDPFGDALRRAIEGKQVGRRPLVVQRFARVEELQPCPILFVAASEDGAVGEAIARTRSWPSLTVGETDAFMRAGGMIRFFLEKNRVRFEVDRVAAEQAGLRVSAHLFRVGRPVTGPRYAAP